MQQLVNRRRMMGSKEHDYSRDYFTMVALEDGDISFMMPENVMKTEDLMTSISYSLNGSEWVTHSLYDPNATGISSITVHVNTGDKLLWKGIGTGYLSDSDDWGFMFRVCRCSIEGNIMSLCKGDNFIGTELEYDYQYYGLFYNNGFYDGNTISDQVDLPNYVINAENLILPNNTTEGCYEYLFYKNEELINPPKLPATVLSVDCYCGMFSNTALIETPELPADTLISGCYEGMFMDCTNLVKAEINATTFSTKCCTDMFNGCSSLTYIKCMATTGVVTGRSGSCTRWVKNVSSTGTFIKHPNKTDWAAGTAGIPSGWTVVDADI